MEKSVFGSAIKTYPSKRNRFSSYRPSTLLFKDDGDDIFDQLIKDEEKKQPLQVTKKNPNKGTFRSTKSYQPSAISTKTHRPLVPRSSHHIKGIERSNLTKVHSHFKQKKKSGFGTKRGKENTLKCSSRLFVSDSDSDNELPSISVYDLSYNQNQLIQYHKRREASRKLKAKPKARPLLTTTKDNCDSNKNDTSLSPTNTENFRFTSNNFDDVDDDHGKVDPFQSSQKLQETVFKKPVPFVERSSDLFYKNAFRNCGATKTRKKLPFLNENYSGCNENSDNLCENSQYGDISGVVRNSQRFHASHCVVNELFNSDNETDDNDQCFDFSVANHEENFIPPMVSTPNFDRNKSSQFFEDRGLASKSNGSIAKELVQISNHNVSDNLEANSISKHNNSDSSSSCIVNKDRRLENSNNVEEPVSVRNTSHEYSYFSNVTNFSIKSSFSMTDVTKETNDHNHESLSVHDSNTFSFESSFGSQTSNRTEDVSSRDSKTARYKTCSNSGSEPASPSHSESEGDEIETITSPKTFETTDLINSLQSLELSGTKFENDNGNSQVSTKSPGTSEYHGERSENSFDTNENGASIREVSNIVSSPVASDASLSRSSRLETFEHWRSQKDTQSSDSDSFLSHMEDEEKCNDDEIKSPVVNEVSATSTYDERNVDLSQNLSNIVSECESLEKLHIFEPLTKDASPINGSKEIENDSSLSSISSESIAETDNDKFIDETSFNNTEKRLSPNRSDSPSTDDFVGWPGIDCELALERKKAYDKEYEKLMANRSQKITPLHCDTEESFCNVNDFPSRLQFVTTRRKRNHALPTLNEEETEENENTNVFSSTRNSLLSTQLSQYQPSFCNSNFYEKSCIARNSIVLNAGKKWRRSFITLKNIKDFGLQLENVDEVYKGRCWKKNVQNLIFSQPSETHIFSEIEECSTIKPGCNETIISSVGNSTSVISEKYNRPDKARFSLCVNTKQTDESGGSVTSSDNSRLFGDKSFVSFINHSRESKIENFELEAGDYSRTCNLSLERYDVHDHYSAKEVVLRHCKQSEPLPFEECFNDRELLNCKKIGEGVYGEVFMLKRSRTRCSVLKIIPIEGDLLINGERQKKFEEIVSELVISSKLSDLRKRNDFYTDNFAELHRCWCVYGKYPQRLIDLWKEYDAVKGSDNDSPKVFDSNQLYIILELSHGGEDLESFVFNNAQQALSVFTQVTNALAVAEEAFMFEHRDLHWGNVLVSKCRTKETKYIIRDRKNIIKLHGVKVTIIDYTLSRISINNCVVYNDIGLDPDLFTAEGDFQFEIYRFMRDVVSNLWDQYVPKTNIFWLHYLLDKMIKEVRYRRSNTKVHLSNLEMIKKFHRSVVNFDSSYEFCCNAFFR